MQLPAASLGNILDYLPSSPKFSSNSCSFPLCLSPRHRSHFSFPLSFPPRRDKTETFSFWFEREIGLSGYGSEERAKNADETFFSFTGQIRVGFIVGYSTQENFLASLGPVVLISSSPPVSARRRKERRTFPTNRGERDLRDREGDGGKISAQTGDQNSSGNSGERRGRRGKLGKEQKDRGRKSRQRTSPLFAPASSWLSPVGGGSVQRALDCGPTSVGFGVDAIEK